MWMSGKRSGCGMARIFEQVAGLVLAAEYKPFVNSEALTTSTVLAKKHERALIKLCLCYSCRASPKKGGGGRRGPGAGFGLASCGFWDAEVGSCENNLGICVWSTCGGNGRTC